LKKIIFIIGFFLFSFLITFFYSCSPPSIMDNPELYKDQVEGWERRAQNNPIDEDAFRNLSMYYVQTHQNEKAQKYLDKGLNLDPKDPALNLYKGINLEFFNKPDEALEYYKKYTSVSNSSPYRDLMEGRYLWIKRQQAYSDIDSLVKEEKEISTSNISDSTMAVFPLIYQGIDKQYAPLSRGFSEMVSIDLAKVKQLKILERIRIQAVLDELKFGQSAVVDQSTAPRVGKLLGAGTIISGDYDVTNKENFRIDLGSWDIFTSERKSWINKSGSLSDLFQLQKEVVFAFLQDNGIDLTQKEKEEIAYIPTQNLQAFLAYSRGLLQEDAGNFQGAHSNFERAVELDPHFKDAGAKLTSTQSLGKAGGNKEKVVSVLRTSDAVVSLDDNKLVQSRMSNLNNNITSNFVQGVDSRSPAQEESNKSENLTPLPPPPPPPPQGKRGQ
jgi:tetratricopeptide (TPR) repeat protein